MFTRSRERQRIIEISACFGYAYLLVTAINDQLYNHDLESIISSSLIIKYRSKNNYYRERSNCEWTNTNTIVKIINNYERVNNSTVSAKLKTKEAHR